LEQEIEDVWEPAVATLGANLAQTPENYETALIVKTSIMTRNRHALVQQLSHPTKPQDLTVQAYQNRLLGLNNAAELLSGISSKLMEQQLKQALYEGMPKEWKSHFCWVSK
jgi:hypothetical protein